MTRRGDGAIIDGILEDCRDNDVWCRLVSLEGK